MRTTVAQRISYARVAAREAGLGAAVVAKRARTAVVGAPRRSWALLAIACSGALVVSATSHFLSGGASGSRTVAELIGRPLNAALIGYLVGYAVCSGAWHAISVCRRLGREEMTRASFLQGMAQRPNWPRNILRERDR